MMTPRELSENLKGLSFVNVTPFDEDGKLNLDGYKENLKFTLEKVKGVKCTITPCGSNGEFVSMSEEEHKAVIKTCVEVVNGEHPVVAGTGRASTYQTIKMSQYAQEVGADGVQVIHPYYFVPTVDGMYEHYRQVAASIDIGVVIYNNPAFSQSWINPKLMRRIIEGCDGKIAGIKENTPHLMLFDSMVQTLKGTGVPIQSGFGEKWYAYQFPYGADGMVSPFGNFFPEYPIKLYEAAQRYDFETIRSLLDMMRPYYAFVGRCTAARGDTGIQGKPGGSIYGEGNVRFGVLKEAMNLMGLHGGYMRLPLTGLNDKERDELKEILRDLKLL